MKKLLAITTLITVLVTAPVNIYALEVTTRSNLDIDESIVKDNSNYSNPVDILLAPIEVNKDFNLTDTSWYKGIYYYTVDRLGFPDMPFHYLVSESGKVYKGNKFGDEKQIAVTDFSQNPVIIAYIHKGNTTSIDPRAEQAIKDLVLQVANYNNINPSKAALRSLRFKRNKESKTIEVLAEKAFGNWESSFNKIVNSITGFSPIQKEYSAEITQVNVTADEVNPGEEVNVSLNVKNTGQNGNYSSSNSEIMLTKVGSGSSIFYINNVWSSQTQTAIMTDAQNLLPGQELQFNFKIKAPLYVGQISETFELRTFSGSKIQSSNIEIKLNVRKGDKTIVAIKNNAAGFANVYSTNSTSSSVLLRAVSGERFFLVSENLQSLWASIDLGNGQVGWIAMWNLTYL